tara:strand:- start:3278 stop:3622 length:345 start_codon:yes stop_codon:yes gene_type:complete
MKNLKSFAFAIMLTLTTSNLFANTDPSEVKPAVQLREEIMELLKAPQFNIEEEEETSRIFFTVSNKGEIVVLNVQTEKPQIAAYIKSRLNYKKTKASTLAYGKTFNVTFKIKKE